MASSHVCYPIPRRCLTREVDIYKRLGLDLVSSFSSSHTVPGHLSGDLDNLYQLVNKQYCFAIHFTETQCQSTAALYFITFVWLLVINLVNRRAERLAAACYTACNAGYATCCTGLGAVAGDVTFDSIASASKADADMSPCRQALLALGLGTLPALAGCSVAQGACMVALRIGFWSSHPLRLPPSVVGHRRSNEPILS